MFHIRRTRGGTGIAPQFANTRRQVRVEQAPVRGVHFGLRLAELPVGYAADCGNFIINKGALRPRSGTSKALTGNVVTNAAGILNIGPVAIQGGSLAFEKNGDPVAVFGSKTHLLRGEPVDGIVTQLVPLHGSAPSLLSNEYWSTSYMFDQGTNETQAVFCQERIKPKYFSTVGATYSDYTFFADVGFTKAGAVVAADNRLVFANISDTSGDQHANRVAWTRRGFFSDWTLALGAGFEDVRDMRGKIIWLHPMDDDGFLIFTTEEIWRARPRRDVAAFDFNPVSRKVSCPYPLTIQTTVAGVTFLGKDFEVWTIRGNQLVALGKRPGTQTEENSRVQGFIRDNVTNYERTFGVYSEQDKEYQLFHPQGDDFDSNGYATRALTYDFDADAWMLQSYSEEYSFGLDFVSAGLLTNNAQWDQAVGTWDSQTSTWDEYGVSIQYQPNIRRPLMFSSRATMSQPYRERTADSMGSTFVSHWRAGGLRHPDIDPWRRVWVIESVCEWENAGASSNASIAWTDNDGSTFFEIRQFTTPQSGISATLVPVRFGGRFPQFEIRSSGNKVEWTRFSHVVYQDSPHGGGTG